MIKLPNAMFFIQEYRSLTPYLQSIQDLTQTIPDIEIKLDKCLNDLYNKIDLCLSILNSQNKKNSFYFSEMFYDFCMYESEKDNNLYLGFDFPLNNYNNKISKISFFYDPHVGIEQCFELSFIKILDSNNKTKKFQTQFTVTPEYAISSTFYDNHMPELHNQKHKDLFIKIIDKILKSKIESYLETFEIEKLFQKIQYLSDMLILNNKIKMDEQYQLLKNKDMVNLNNFKESFEILNLKYDFKYTESTNS